MATRTYRSPVREAKAAETRSRIARAAKDSFAEYGFAGATIADIARRAGVSSQTVHTHFGTKGAIVLALLTQLETDAGAAAWRERIAAAPTSREKLAAWAEWTAAMLSPSRDFVEVLQGAGTEPAMVELKEQGDAHRRAAITALVGTIAEAADLRPGLEVGRAVDRAWILTGVEVYLGAVACGWTDGEYAHWLGETLSAQLLAEQG